jgi:hypothetical protein
MSTSSYYNYRKIQGGSDSCPPPVYPFLGGEAASERPDQTSLCIGTFLEIEKLGVGKGSDFQGDDFDRE